MNALDDDERNALYKAGVRTALDVLCMTSNELAHKLNLNVSNAQHIVAKVAKALAPTPQVPGAAPYVDPRERIKTGDAELDKLLGGGILTGAIWEVVGESSAGKTQLAFQLAIAAMLSPTTNKLERSACYLSTKSSFQTERLAQILESRSRFSSSSDGGSNTVDQMLELLSYRHLISHEDLINFLSMVIPNLAEQKDAVGSPLRLIVIDALAPLLVSDETSKPTRASYRERDQILTKISGLLSSLSRKYNFAVVVVNEVSDVFSQDDRRSGTDGYISNTKAGMMLSWEIQTEWSGRTPKRLVEIGAINERQRKEAKLGLPWTYRIHARIMLMRTNRLWHPPQDTIGARSSTASDIRVSGATKSDSDSDLVISAPPAKRRRVEDLGPPLAPASQLASSSSASHVPTPNTFTPAFTSVAAIATSTEPSFQDANDIPLPQSTSLPASTRLVSFPRTPPVMPIPIAKRNLSVLFSKYGSRGSIDYLILASGLETIEGSMVVENAMPEIHSQLSSRLGAGDHASQTSSGVNPETRVRHHIQSQSPSHSQKQDAGDGGTAIAVLSRSPPSTEASSSHNTAPTTPSVSPSKLQLYHATRASLDPSTSTPSQAQSQSSTNPTKSTASMIDWEFYFPGAYGGEPFYDGLSEPDLDTNIGIGVSVGSGGKGDDGDEQNAGAMTGAGVDASAQEDKRASTTQDVDSDAEADLDDVHVHLTAGNKFHDEAEFELELDLDDAMLDLDLDLDTMADNTATGANGGTGNFEHANDNHHLTASNTHASNSQDADKERATSPTPSEAETEIADNDDKGDRFQTTQRNRHRTDDLSHRTPSLTSARSLPH